MGTLRGSGADGTDAVWLSEPFGALVDMLEGGRGEPY